MVYLWRAVDAEGEVLDVLFSTTAVAPKMLADCGILSAREAIVFAQAH